MTTGNTFAFSLRRNVLRGDCDSKPAKLYQLNRAVGLLFKSEAVVVIAHENIAYNPGRAALGFLVVFRGLRRAPCKQ